MGLIVENFIKSDDLLKPENAVSAYLLVPSKYLSEAYELVDGSIIAGEILGIKDLLGRDVEGREEVIGAKISFVLVTVFSNDYLYISKDSWPLLRDYGIIAEDYSLRVRITTATVNEEEIEIYPKVEKAI